MVKQTLANLKPKQKQFTDDELIDQPLGKTSYRGNVLLKQIGEVINWTPKLIAEYLKCQADPIYFIETYVKIVELDKGLVPFILRDYQREMILSAVYNRYTILATARQVGKSTTMVAFLLWYVLFSADKTVALLANKGETAREILGRVHTSYQNLPKWLQQGVFGWNKGSIHLENGSRIIAAATSSSAIRGYAINVLMLDEAAFIEGWDDFESSVMPTISSSKESKVIMVSTPNGLNHFYSYWVKANKIYATDPIEKAKWNGFNPIMVNWDQVPGRDEEWRRQTLASMGGSQEKFNTEYGVEFQGSSGTLIAGWKLKELAPNMASPIAERDHLSQYQSPEKGHIYMIVADTSHGKGLDSSAFHVIDITKIPFDIVAVYRNNMVVPEDYATILNRIGKLYNDAHILCENNDMGSVVTHILQAELEYENILFTTAQQGTGRGGKKLVSGATGDQRIEAGIRTTKPVKALGCSLLKLLIEQNQLPITDFHTIEELSRFSKKGTSYEAEAGSQDDLVMGLVLFAWIANQDAFRELTDIHAVRSIREINEAQFEENMSPFGFIADHNEPKMSLRDHMEHNWMFLETDPTTEHDLDTWGELQTGWERGF